jgi:hypothetical protein
LFDQSHRIRIADFGQSPFDLRESAVTGRGVEYESEAPAMRSGEERTAKIDVLAFALILFEIVVSLPVLETTSLSEAIMKLPVNACERVEIPGLVSKFVSVLIGSGLSANPREKISFDDTSETLKKNYFKIADGVDSDEVQPLSVWWNPQRCESSEELHRDVVSTISEHRVPKYQSSG